ncbi:MAG: methionyl-tRNA formyltransferase [Legionellaceae bacterium]|nr:methionyl-tRNA formyltransferase [Legionellaceae bacterium]
MTALNIVFAGTPEFTCSSLNAIAASSHNLIALYTQPDRPKGRGRAVQPSAAKVWAKEHDVPIYQPVTLRDISAQDTLRALNPDILVVIAYGLILPPEVLEIPRLGCINVHASLLPHWRGAAPIQYSILNGDTTTGVSIMQMDAGMDTGPVFKTVTCAISDTTTAATLHDTLAHLATTPLIEVLDTLATGTASLPKPQDNQQASYAPKITKQDALIDWTKPAKEIVRQIHAFNPWPIARTEAAAETLRVLTASALNMNATEPPGYIADITPEGVRVATGDGYLHIHTLQFAGGKVLSVADWLNANKKTLYPGLILQ